MLAEDVLELLVASGPLGGLRTQHRFGGLGGVSCPFGRLARLMQLVGISCRERVAQPARRLLSGLRHEPAQSLCVTLCRCILWPSGRPWRRVLPGPDGGEQAQVTLGLHRALK